ncbi:VOC family protein [Intestinirhabdus alba]|jgi:hypothetical protein|uniref:Phenazine antibiotic resistance protein n=1 Tax=Intestinirhabdus alba TaxID=2899544 RepID=A0A6L6IS72_9ENTR|nr:VOC family protein [Intestinirhabdus alba]MTH48797.1 drug:proton antiporter [Intestinirhabdus alba]
MLTAEMSIIYVSYVMKSVDFYASLLHCEPVEKGPTFALFVLKNSFKLGLWSAYTVEPPVNEMPARATGEIIFTVAEREDVDAAYKLLGRELKVTVIQKPVTLDFGYSFTVIDPDGHRLRICYLEEAV